MNIACRLITGRPAQTASAWPDVPGQWLRSGGQRVLPGAPPDEGGLLAVAIGWRRVGRALTWAGWPRMLGGLARPPAHAGGAGRSAAAPVPAVLRGGHPRVSGLRGRVPGRAGPRCGGDGRAGPAVGGGRVPGRHGIGGPVPGRCRWPRARPGGPGLS